MSRYLVVLLPLLVGGCATAQVMNSPVLNLSLEEAQQATKIWEGKQAEISANDPLLHPKSLEDVFEILQRDQTNLFEAGVAFAAKQEGIKALTLQAQIEISWGESQLLLSEIAQDLANELGEAARQLAAKQASGDKLDANESARLAELQRYFKDVSYMAGALSRLSTEHLRDGARLARQVISKSPNDYHGYRVAADYYLLQRDWVNFDLMVKKVEEINPQSTGLLFLKGKLEAVRYHNTGKAIKLLQEALQRDPKFVRAQVEIVRLQSHRAGFYDAYLKLKALNPSHQLVVWVGPFIEQAHQAFVEYSDRTQERNESMAQPE